MHESSLPAFLPRRRLGRSPLPLFTFTVDTPRFMITNIHQHDAVILDEKLNRDPVKY